MHGQSIISVVFAFFLATVRMTAAGVLCSNDSSAYTLPDLEVIAPMHANLTIIPSQQLKGEDLRNLSALSVADAMRYFSGVHLKDYGGVGGVKTLDVRSMGSNHTGIFYDGIQLGNAQNGQVDLGKFSLDNIEEISLFNGQKSEIFQPAKDFGTAGTVYIRTRRPKFDTDKRINLTATFRTGSFGLVNPSFRLEYQFSRRVAASINSEYTFADGKYRFRLRRLRPDGSVAWDTTATRRNGQINSFRTEATVFGRINEGRWHAKAYYYDSSRGIPGAIVNNVWKHHQHQWDRNFFLQGNWQKSLDNRNDIMVKGKYSNDFMRYRNDDPTQMLTDNSFRQNEIYLSAAWKHEFVRNLEMNISSDWQLNALQSDMASFLRPVRNSFFNALALAWHNDYFRMQGSILSTVIADRRDASSGSSAKVSSTLSRFTPSFFVSWHPEGRSPFTIRAFFKQAFRMPTFNDLYYTDIGNAALKPESAWQLNLGSTFSLTPEATVWKNMQASLDVYHNRVSDKIIAVPKGSGQYRWMMMNIGKVRITGADLAASGEIFLQPGIIINGRVTYTWQKALDYSHPSDNKDAAGTYRSQIAYIPLHSGSATLGTSWKMFHLNYSFIYVGERWHNSSNIPANHEPPWYTSDLALSGVVKAAASSFRLSLEVNNLLDQQYEAILNYPMPGRNYRFTLQFTY